MTCSRCAVPFRLAMIAVQLVSFAISFSPVETPRPISVILYCLAVSPHHIFCFRIIAPICVAPKNGSGTLSHA